MTPESPGRYPSERSGTRAPPPVEDPIQLLLVEVREQRAEMRAMRRDNDELEGRVSAVVVGAEKRLQNVANGNVRADVEATRFDMGRENTKLKKQLVAAALTASIAVAGLITRWAVGSDVSEAASIVATASAKDVAEETAAELVTVAVDRKADAADAATTMLRVTALETRFVLIEDKLNTLLERLPEPDPKPKKGPR